MASTTFRTYRHCWLRDASFSAHALDRAGEHATAARFYDWGAAVVDRHGWRIERALERGLRGEAVAGTDLLPCRFTVDGDETKEPWAEFQMDGYGTFLWALAHHLIDTRADAAPYVPAIRLVLRYVAAFWDMSQFDCWEEREGLYPATYACLYGGLRAIAPYLASGDAHAADAAAREMRDLVLTRGLHDGRLAKMIDGSVIDASLLWCVWPFELVAADDPVALATMEAVERELLHDGGVHRFTADTYFGGGQWILLTASLGCVYARMGRRADAERLERWIRAHAGRDGSLPEQVRDHLLAPEKYGDWVRRWGPPASPLTWSHAMYLLLLDELGAHL